MKSENICVVGLGYVGLPLAFAAANLGLKVFGIDSNTELIEKLKVGLSPFKDSNDSNLDKIIRNKNFIPSTDFSVVSHADIILVCVPTPLSDKAEPDLSYVEAAIKSISKYLKKGSLIILESTVAPGTTRNHIVPLLEQESGLNKSQFDLVFSPERIDPGNATWNINNTPKILAGLTPEAGIRAIEFYSLFIENVIDCKNLEVAEMAKLLENTFRFVNISFINELSFFCNKIGIDINEVIKAAQTKPYGFMPFYPSVGIGGHCIPVDPLYLSSKARDLGVPVRFIDLADQINRETPKFHVQQAEDELRAIKGNKVLVLGVAYKPNISDVRETPVKSLIFGLREKGFSVCWNDDLVKVWNGELTSPITDKYDLAIIATQHDYMDLKMLGKTQILNTRNSIR